MTHSTGALVRTEITPARSTAPLSPAAVSAMASLEARLAGRAVVRAVAVYETAALHRANLAELAAAGELSDLDADGFDIAADLMAGSRATLAAAGMLHLVEAVV
ncbi:hypothetical protein [Streptomyces sp. NPDC086182]|uniref:hypothetical protein n=1 Tax=Streptomyces sp. NPDC086182 TaxID=3155058 RepID=UPI00342636AD